MSRLRYAEIRLRRAADPLILLHRLVPQLPRPLIVYERAGVWSLGAGVLGEVLVDGRHVVYAWRGTRRSARLSDRPFADVAQALSRIPLTGWTAYGWVAFEYGYLTAGRPVPEGTLLHLIVPKTQVLIGASQCVIRSVEPQLLARLHDTLAAPDGPTENELRASPVPVDAADPAAYQQMVAAAIREIRLGSMQKVIVSRQVPVAFEVDLLGTYRLGRAGNQPARSFLLDTEQIRAVGFSPETVLTAQTDGRVNTNPLAGTGALAGDDRDVARAAVLCCDPKEVFEHAIAVKLAFDELGRVCTPGSIVIDDYMSIAHRGTVQHLASRVSGDLAMRRTCWDALEAVFPAVTVSGVPKAAAFDCIARLESRPRGLYGGAVLTATHDGDLDAAVVLRTLFEHDGTAWLQAGAGIVAASDPLREYEETCLKLRSVASFVVAKHQPSHMTAASPSSVIHAASGDPGQP